MIRLLFCILIALPFAILPWIANGAGTLPEQTKDGTFDRLVLEANLSELSDCEATELPIFFRDTLITTHSADFIADSLDTARLCGPVRATILSILPERADRDDWIQSQDRARELASHVEAIATITDANVQVRLSDQTLREDTSTLYMNGRAAILHLDPQSLSG